MYVFQFPDFVTQWNNNAVETFHGPKLLIFIASTDESYASCSNYK